MIDRALYTLVMYLGTPVILYRLALRGLRYRGYFARWRERFGFFLAPDLDRAIWVHAVSMGEVNAAAPLIDALMQRYRDHDFVITTVTPTGSMRVKRLYGERVFHVYLPYDLPPAVNRFLARVRPAIAVIMETEIWPNLYHACHRARIPIVMANARLSARSLRGYGPVAVLARGAIRRAHHIAAQSQPDAERLLALGAVRNRLSVAGNTKYDMRVPPTLVADGAALRAASGGARPVWIAASTHEAEEFAVISAHLEVLKRYPDALLIWSPRHPERFAKVATLCRQLGLRTATRSESGHASGEDQCFIGDTLGELLLFYAASDVAFVGGSLAAVGGHNMLEPAALGKPVLAGPHLFNFQEIAETLASASALVRVDGAPSLGAAVIQLFTHPARAAELGRNAAEVFAREGGAVARVIEVIDSALVKRATNEAIRAAR